MLRSALKPTAARFDDPPSEEDMRSDSSTGLSSNQWAPFTSRWHTERRSAPKDLDRGRTKSPKPSRRVRFVHIVPSSRPRSHTRTSYSDEATWGVLFDSRGRETDRMEHILKKLGGYIRANWAPYDTHVITPDKMAKFYSCYQIETERLPFRELFSPKTSNKRIAAVYDHIGVDYIQHDGRHSTPGLTRLGFAQFLIKTIRAFPDEEHRRLQRIIQAIPFDIDDNTQGGGYVRVPRSLPRYYLPKGPGVESYQRLLHDAFRRAIYGSSSSSSSSSSSHSSGSSSEGGRSSRKGEKGNDKKSSHHRHHHDGHPRHHTTTTTTTTTLVNLLSPKPEKKKKKKVTIITPTSSPPPPLIRNPPPPVSSGPGVYDYPQLQQQQQQQQQQQKHQLFSPTSGVPNYYYPGNTTTSASTLSTSSTDANCGRRGWHYDDDNNNNNNNISEEIFNRMGMREGRERVGGGLRYAARPV